ncbi:MAG: Secretion system C-terminal sorting domain [Bacteroidota bacterium]
MADTGGNKLYDKTFFSLGHDEDGLVVEMNPGTYVGVVNSSCSIGGYKTQDSLGMGDVWICAVSPAVSGVEDAQLRNTISVYPNPLVEDILTIKSDDKIDWIEILTSENKLVDRKSNSDNSNSITISLSNIPNGIYFLRIGILNRTIIKKLIVINN